MLDIPIETKADLFKLLKKERNAFIAIDLGLSLLDFLQDIWELNAMPSEDPRYTNAYDDVYQHTVNNDDWDFDYLFIRRLKLLEDKENRFDKFLETIVSPKFRNGEDEIIKFVLLINPYIGRYGYQLSLVEYDNSEKPIYKINLKEESPAPLDIKKNSIPFYVVESKAARSNYLSSHDKPTIFPSFILVFNDGWNDYSYYTEFSLFYYDSDKAQYYIGDTKVMCQEEKNIYDIISKEFTYLDDTFCSLGQASNYYSKLKDLLGKDFESILFALKDCAFFPEIQEKYEKSPAFINSLIRWNENEKILREIKYVLYGYDLSNLYKFRYNFKPVFSDTNVDINFDFNSDPVLPSRIYAIVGKNGTGKTQLITSLPINISKKNDDVFVPKTPLFSKVIAVSYSAFDKFEVPRKTSAFNYVYCGLRNEKGDEHSERGLTLRFHNSWKRIEKNKQIEEWRRILLNFMDENVINEFIIPSTRDYNVSIEGFNKIKNQLSSGQNIILYIITEIIANIRFDSLLLYDEPETHLHPNAITQLMNTIYELVHEFQSYCIIATHSPLVIRELFSKNVYVMERDENVPSIRRIGLESFGENLTTLTEEVFGNKQIPKQYKKIIDELVRNEDSYEKIISLLEFDDVSLSLNTKLYIKSAIKEKNEKP